MKKIKKIIKFLIPIRYKETKIMIYHNISKYFYNRNMKFLAEIFEWKIYKKFNCIISSKANIGENIVFPHPIGIVIGEGVNIGNNVTIYQNVTIGRKKLDIVKYPKINDNCIIYCNSTLLGDITLAKNTIVGANSLVITDTMEGCIYAGIPAKKIEERK